MTICRPSSKFFACLCWLAFTPTFVFAQEQPATLPSSNPFTLQINYPTSNPQDPQNTDWTDAPTLNSANCTAADVPVDIYYDLTAVESQITATSVLQVYIINSPNCSIQDTTPVPLLYSQTINGQYTGDIGSQGDLDTLTFQKILELDNNAGQAASQPSSVEGGTGACGNQIDGAQYAVCFEINQEDGTTGNIFAYVPFTVYTEVPPTPTFGLSVGDGYIGVTPTAGDSDNTDIEISFFNYAWCDRGNELDPNSDDANTNNQCDINSPAGLTTNPPSPPYTTVQIASTSSTTGYERITGLIDNDVYDVSVSAVDEAGNLGEYAALQSATPVTECNFWQCYPGPIKHGYCFVTTAAFGSYDSQFVQVFRDYRDQVLMKSRWGREAVLWYYRHGLAPARWLAAHPVARAIAAAGLLVPYLAAWPIVRAGPGLLLVILLLSTAFFLFTARFAFSWGRRGATTIVVVVALLLGSNRAYADDINGYDWNSRGHFDENEEQAPQEPDRPRIGIGIKAGPYAPGIDSNPAAQGVYRDFFGYVAPIIGGSGRRAIFDLDGDLYILRSFGLLGVGGTVGFWQILGKNKICYNSNGLSAACTPGNISSAQPAQDNSQLTIIPLSLSAVYKFDWFLFKYRVPLVPYVKAGIDAYFYRVDSGGQEARQFAGHTGPLADGATWGYHVNPGLGINMNWLESIQSAFNAVGIQGSYITLEWYWAWVNDFGNSQSWTLSDSSFLGGISFDF